MDPSMLENQPSINSLLNGDGASLIPESLVTSMIVGFILINLLGLLFVVVYVTVAIRNWKVQSAVLQMQKDLTEIKKQVTELAENGAPTATSSSQPSDSSNLIASASGKRSSDATHAG